PHGVQTRLVQAGDRSVGLVVQTKRPDGGLRLNAPQGSNHRECFRQVTVVEESAVGAGHFSRCGNAVELTILDLAAQYRPAMLGPVSHYGLLGRCRHCRGGNAWYWAAAALLA